MIIEARGDLVKLEGRLDKNLWPAIQAAANLLLRSHPQGILVDGSELTECTPEGAKTFSAAIDYIEQYRARIIFCRLSDQVMEVTRTVPGVRSRLPVAATVEEARASLKLARPGAQPLPPGGRTLQDIFVPLLRPEAVQSAVTLACRLAKADSQKARLHLAYLLEVPRGLPLSAPLPEEEAVAQQALDDAEQRVRREGLTPLPHVTRARDAAEEIITQAGNLNANLIVLAALDGNDPAEDTVSRVTRAVLARAPCEVVLHKQPQQ